MLLNVSRNSGFCSEHRAFLFVGMGFLAMKPRYFLIRGEKSLHPLKRVGVRSTRQKYVQATWPAIAKFHARIELS